MNITIQKPLEFILFDKSMVIYTDVNTYIDFPITDIDKHPKWFKREYNKKGYMIHREDYDGFWANYDYNDDGSIKFYENSYGIVLRVK